MNAPDLRYHTTVYHGPAGASVWYVIDSQAPCNTPPRVCASFETEAEAEADAAERNITPAQRAELARRERMYAEDDRRIDARDARYYGTYGTES